MSVGSILLVHGTGVRFRSYMKGFEIAEKTARNCSVRRRLLPCAWGDPLGVEFTGYSLPDAPTAEQNRKEEDEFAHWVWILDDPLLELSLLGIPDGKAATARLLEPEQETKAEQNLNLARTYF